MEEIKSHFNLHASYISSEIGYGVFTNEFIPQGSIVETVYCVPINPLGEWDEYKFKNHDKTFLPLGFGVIYNHNDTPNIRWDIIGHRLIKFISLKDIQIGEQLTHSYGKNYWKNKKYKKLM